MRSGRGGWAVRLTGAGCAVLLAAAGVTAYWIIDVHRDRPLPSRVLGTQAIALVNPGKAGPSGWTGNGPAPGTLQTSGGRLLFTTGAQPEAEWTADQMEGGTYIFIYLNGGLCLTSPSPPASTAVLASCTLQASQRWVRQQLTVGASGLDYYQLRNDADSRCLGTPGPGSQAAVMQPCQPVAGWQQLITFVQSS